jgi:hypothetical protein
MTTDDKREMFNRLAHAPGIQTAQEYADSLSGRPEPWMQIGEPVAWTIDGEPGVSVATNDSAICVKWQETGLEWYSFGSGAIERIEPFTQRSTCRFKR